MVKPERIECEQHEGNAQCDRHHSDGSGQPCEPVVELGKQRRDDEADSSDVEHGGPRSELST